MFLCNFTPHQWLNYYTSLPDERYSVYRHNMHMSKIVYRHKSAQVSRHLWKLSGPTSCSKQGQFSLGCSRFRAARNGLLQLILV